MSECHCAVMWEVLLDQDMTVKSAHLRDSEDTDSTEGTGCHRKNLTLGYISSQMVICGAL